MTIRAALLGTTLLAIPGVAAAQPVTGLYVGAGAMGNVLQNETLKRLTLDGGNPDHAIVHGSNPKFDLGYGGVASVGWGFGNGIRVELEGNYRTNDLRTVSGIYGSSPSGHEEKYGAMVNALYDFSFSDIGLSILGLDAVNPYLGIGAGWAQNRWHSVSVPIGPATPGYSSLNVNNAEDVFAYQAIAGVAVPIYSVVPGLSFTAEYRFYSTPNDRKYTAQYIGPGVPSGSTLKVGDDFNHSFLVGLRYAFNVPVPPPPPAPAPAAAPVAAPARTYLVFFDWDRADLSDRARQIIGEAASNVGRVQVTRIEVNGYTDRSGTPAYNQRLSVRRAQAVAGELVRDGVPQGEIATLGFGESNPLVPTAAGVREPQNRRVEIILK